MVVGTILALIALSFVLYPLIPATLASGPREPAGLRSEVRDSPAAPVETLREIEFDCATGKLSESDYEQLKAESTRKAVAVMRAGGGTICEQCGVRAEIDARFCSNCGRPLPA